MTKIKIVLGLNLYEDWSEEDLEQYDEDASKERYADLCCEAIQDMNPEIEIDEFYSYNHFPKVLNWEEIWKENEEFDFQGLCQDIHEICLGIHSEYEWLFEKIW